MGKKSGRLAAELPESVLAFFRECGKKGGRKRTAPHVEGWKGCRCAECRNARAAAKGPVAEKRAAFVVEVPPIVEGLDVLDQLIAEGREAEMSIGIVPDDMMLVSEMAERIGYSEEDVWVSAMGKPKEDEPRISARPRKLGDGRRVVSMAWAEMKLKKKGRA